MVRHADPDRELVRTCVQELPYRTTSFQALYQRHERGVITLCRYLTKNQEDAETAAQEAWISVFHKLKSFQACSTFKTWLYRIVKNACVDVIRKRPSGVTEQQSFAPDPQPKMEAKLHLHATFDRLSPAERKIILLKLVRGYSFHEVAEALNTSISAAKMRFYRACQNFKEKYQN